MLRVLLHHALEFVREHFHELRQHRVPVLENAFGERAAGRIEMPVDRGVQNMLIVRVEHLFQIDRSLIATVLNELARFIQHISDAARHSGGEIPPRFAKHDDEPVGHVFAAVIAQPFHHRGRAGIPHREALASHAIEKRLAAGGPVENDVADQNVLLGHKRRSLRRIDDQASAGKPFADIIVRVAFQFQRDAPGEKRPETLPRGAREFKSNRVVGQSGRPVFARDPAGKHGADRAMHVLDRQLDHDRGLVVDRILRVVDQFVIERFLEPVILLRRAVPAHARWNRRIVENRRKVQPARLPMLQSLVHFEHVDAAHHLFHPAEAQLRHDLPHLLRNEEEEIDDVLRLTRELRAQHRILRGDADRASVQMAFAHHDAAQSHQRHGGESELFGAQQRRDGNVAPGLEFPVRLHYNAAAQIVHHENLLRFREPQFPGRARVLERSKRRRSGAAIVSADQDDIGVRFRHTRGDRSHAHFSHQFDRDSRLRIYVLEVVDQLREVFDRVDIVMRRGRDQTHARHGMPHLRDDFIDLVAGKLAAFAGFRPLRHLDLQIVGIDEVVRGHAKASRSNLLDRAAPQIAVRIALETLFVFPALTRIRLGADTVHRNRQRLVRFFGNRAERHRAGRESLHDFARRFHFPDRHRSRRLELEQPAQRTQMPALFIDEVRVFLESLEASLPDRLLHFADARWIQQMILAANPERVVAAHREFRIDIRQRLECRSMLHGRFTRNDIEPDALYPR